MKAMKIFLIIGACILVLGLIVFIIAMCFGGFNAEYEVKNFKSTQPVNAFELNLSAGEASVEYFDGDAVEIDYPQSDWYGYTVGENNGRVTVAPKSKFSINFGFFRKIPQIKVKLPADSELSLTVKMSAGVLKIGAGEFKDADIRLSAGTLTWTDAKCDDVKFRLSAGDAHINGLDGDKIDCHISAGELIATDVTANLLKVHASAGHVEVGLHGKAEEYSVTVSKSAGSSNLVNRVGTVAGKKIDADISAGKVDVNFID